jgi:hypothetical protein
MYEGWALRGSVLAMMVVLGAAGLTVAGTLDNPAEPESKTPAKETALLKVQFHEGDREFPPPTMRFGLLLPQLPARLQQSNVKLLTFDPWGWTNNTCLKIDGAESLFGLSPPAGKWGPRKAPLDGGRLGMRSVWVYPDSKVHVVQTVEVVRGEQTGKVDTCLVRYDIENKDSEEHTVGLRFLLDTFIGTNDGAPFLVPGEKALVETLKDYRQASHIPAFVQALEKLQFKSPGVVAHLKLRMGGGLEDPVRVTLGGWPNPNTGTPGAAGPLTKWNVPVMSMRQLVKGNQYLDSAVTIYWAEKKMPAGSKRAVGFTYGLGNFSSDDGGKIGLVLAGPFRAGAAMTVLALVKGPEEGQTITLKLPKEMTLTKGEATQKVPLAPLTADNNFGPVTWEVRTPTAGIFALGLELSTGASLRQGVRINPKESRRE